MNVLVACEESQRVCIAFRKRGFNAFSCDIIDCSGGHEEWHIKQDVLPLLNGNCEFTTCDGTQHKIDSKWDLIIAHPPCTYLCIGSACRLYPHKGIIDEERYKKGLKAKEFFMSILNSDCDYICVENPMPLKIFNMPNTSQYVHPYQFDIFHKHPYTKKTGLWLKNLPLLTYTTPNNMPIAPYVPSGTGRKMRGASYGMAKRGEDSKNRAKTFEGVADAFAEQWGDYLLNENTKFI